MWISKIYWTWSPHDCLVYILCTITNCAVHFTPRGVTWGEDYCVLQCTLKTWFHPISFSKKCKVMKTLLNFYPKYYPRLSCTMIDVSAHYVIPPPQKISSYAFIVYYTKYLIFILSDLLKSIISGYTGKVLIICSSTLGQWIHIQYIIKYLKDHKKL